MCIVHGAIGVTEPCQLTDVLVRNAQAGEIHRGEVPGEQGKLTAAAARESASEEGHRQEPDQTGAGVALPESCATRRRGTRGSNGANEGRDHPEVLLEHASLRSALDLEDCLEQNRPLPDRSRCRHRAVACLVFERSLRKDHSATLVRSDAPQSTAAAYQHPDRGSPPLDRYSTSPSGKRSRMICVSGMSQRRGELSSPLFVSAATRSTRWPFRSLSITFHALPRRLIVAPTDGIGLFVQTTSKSPPG